MYLKRKIDAYLKDWKTDSQRKPLIIKGSRQVGKTKSIQHFAEENYENIIEINFVSEPIYKQITENGYTIKAIIQNISRKYLHFSTFLRISFKRFSFYIKVKS